MRRVLHIINGEFYSGAERVQDLLAQGLLSHGFEVVFALLKPGKFAERRQYLGSPIHNTPMRSRLDFGLARRLVELINNENIALVHTHTPRAAMIGRVATLLTQRPFVHHVHSPTVRDTHQPLRNLTNAIAERLALIGATRLFTVSESLRNHMRYWGISGHRIVVAPNGVPVRVGLPHRDLPDETWTLGTMALFRPRKGVHVLVQALALLRQQGYAVRLRLVGGFETPEYEREVHGLAARLGVAEAIDWVGFANDVNAQFDRMDLFVLPSLYGEGMPMVVLEALASGVPVVASQVEGIGEVVREGIEGALVKPDDPRALAGAIAKFLTGQYDWRCIHKAAVMRQQEEYSDVRMAKRIAQQYDEILAHG